IGTILSINSFIVIFAQPFWGMISDRIRSVKKVFLLCLITSTIVIQFFPVIPSAIGMGILLAALAIFEAPLGALMDSLVIQQIRNEPDLSYGSIRLWGSLGYAVFAYLFGLVVDKAPMHYNFIIFAVMATITILITRKIKDKGSASSISFKEMRISQLLKNYSYISFL